MVALSQNRYKLLLSTRLVLELLQKPFYGMIINFLYLLLLCLDINFGILDTKK